MKVTYTIPRDRLQPPVRSKELAAFTWMLQKPGGLEILATAGISVPDIFEIIHHTNPDDPPDFSAWGHGFEVTEFPPNQSAVQAVYMQGGGKAMVIPAFQRTGRDINNRGAKAFLETGANLGYHCVELMYPDDVAAAEVCRDDPDPNSFEAFRMALIQGGASAHVTIERTDSIENRLIKLLLLLRQRRPREEWGQFLDGREIAWERIAVAGQSQGGGHAGIIAVKHRVARVIMFGAPKDFSRARQQPAQWYSEEKATPVAAFFAINHRQDRQGCTFPEELQNLHALGSDQIGPLVDVDQESPPYRHSRVLVTNYPGTKVDSKIAHGTALTDKNQAVFRRTWIYMLTENGASVP